MSELPNEQITTPEGDAETNAGVSASSDTAGAHALAPLTAERLFDIALGAMAVAVEATGKRVHDTIEQARTLQDNAPVILETLEDRGRPLRERLLGKLREGFSPIPDEPTAEEDAAAARTADDDITALEQRVRELEAQVTTTPESLLTLESGGEVIPAGDETPAEGATYVPHPDPTLAESPYAISETEEETQKEHAEEGSPSSEPEA